MKTKTEAVVTNDMEEAAGAGGEDALRTRSAPLRVETIDQLQGLIDERVLCRFKLSGRQVELPVTRLSAATAEQVRTLRRQAQPPYLESRKDYDYLHPAYVKLKEENERKARSIIVYKHCPAVAEKKPGLTTPEEIHPFVQGLLSEIVLEILSATIQGGEIELEVQERTNFTFPGGLES